MKRNRISRRRGLTLAELLVAMSLFAVVSLVTLELYLSAETEFEHSSGQMALNQRGRVAVDKITQLLKTAAPALNSNTESFIHPNSQSDIRQQMYEADFVSSIGFQPNSSLAGAGGAWQVNDTTSAAYVSDPSDPRYIYENDLGMTAFVSRQPSLYRYRIAWNHLASANLTTKGRNIPPRAVFFERLRFGDGSQGDNNGSLGWGEGPNAGAAGALLTPYVFHATGAPWLADTGTPYSGGGMKARILARNIHYLAFYRDQGSVIQLRMKLYNRDPETYKVVEGSTMRRPGHGGNGRPDDRTKQRFFLVDLVTNIELPNTY